MMVKPLGSVAAGVESLAPSDVLFWHGDVF